MVIIIMVVIVSTGGSLGPLTPESDPLRRLRGWEQLAGDLKPAIKLHGATAVIADRRATASLLSWHFYNEQVEVLIHDVDSIPSNHFELNHSWQPDPGRHLIAISGAPTPPNIKSIIWLPPMTNSTTQISQNKSRNLNIFHGIE
jgi:hypothetical protein